MRSKTQLDHNDAVVTNEQAMPKPNQSMTAKQNPFENVINSTIDEDVYAENVTLTTNSPKAPS